MKYIVIILSLMLILTGCKKQVDYDDEEISAQYVNRLNRSVKVSHTFKKTTINLDKNYNDYFYDNDRIYFVCGDNLVSYDNNGENMEITELPENTVDIAINENIIIYNGTEIIRDNEVICEVILEQDEEFVDIYTDKLGRIYYFTSKSVIGMYRDGNIVFNMKINGRLKEAFQTVNGEILLHIDERYVYLDVKNNKLDREITLPNVPYEYEIIMGNGFELYLLSADMNLYGYTEKENVPIKIMDMINSGINIFDISDFKVISSEFMMYNQNNESIVFLNKSDSSELQSKLPIKIASYGYDKKLIDLIIEFNTFNKIYHVNLIDYSIYDLDNDISAGNIPDVFISDENLSIDEYILKGMFMDLSSMNTGKFLIDSIFKAFNYNNRLYKMPSNFIIHSFAGKTAIVGEKFYWSMNEFNNIIPDLESRTRLISNITDMNMLYLLTTAELQSYLFKEEGYSYGFKDNRYINLLDISLHVGAEIYFQGMYRGDNEEFISGKTLMYYLVMNQPDDYNTLYDVFGTDEISLKGIPTNRSDTGFLFEPVKSYSISKHSEAIDGAWEFVEMLMYEYYDEGYFSSVESIFDEQINNSSLSEEDKIYIADLIKNHTPVNIFPMNNEIFDMIDAEAVLFHAGSKSINYTTDAIDMKMIRFLKKYNNFN